MPITITLPTPTALVQPRPISSRGVERRAWVRSTWALEAACSVPALELEVIWPARVENLSAGGLGLVASRRFEVGTVLHVELPTGAGRFLGALAAEVLHVAEHPRGGWLVGCAWSRFLSADELETVLSQEGQLA